MEIWIRPSGQAATPSSQRGGSESSRDSEQDGELGSLSASDVSSFAHSVSHSFSHRAICLSMSALKDIGLCVHQVFLMFFLPTDASHTVS